MSAAGSDAVSGIAPRGADGIPWDGGSIFLGGDEEFSAEKPAHGGLRRTFGYSYRLGQFMIAHLKGGVFPGLFGGEPKVDEEAGGLTIMPDQVTHQYVHNVIVQVRHSYTDE